VSTTTLRTQADEPWYAGLTQRHWRILWGSYVLNGILTPEQTQAKPFYIGAANGITLLGWGIGGLAPAEGGDEPRADVAQIIGALAIGPVMRIRALERVALRNTGDLEEGLSYVDAPVWQECC
jgi:hypothetical protein